MKLRELRTLVIKYDRTWYARKLIYGDHPEVVQLKEFMKKLDQMSPDYEFTVSDRFALLTIIQSDSDLPIIKSIRSQISLDDHIFEIFSALDKLGLMTKQRFEMIDGLTHHQLWDLYALLYVEKFDRSILSAEVLQVILAVFSDFTYDRDSLRESLTLLARNNCLTPIALNLVRDSQPLQARQIVKIFAELELANCLNDMLIQNLVNMSSYYEYADLFALLNRASIKITDKIIKRIFSCNSINHVNEVLSAVIDSECHVNQEMVIMLLQQDFIFFMYRVDFFKVFQAYGMLDDKSFAFICDSKEDFSFKIILNILSEQTLLLRNKSLIERIINDEIDLNKLSTSIKYLKSAGILDQETLELCANKFIVKPTTTVSWYDFIQVIELLAKANINIPKNCFVSLCKWSDLNIERLCLIVKNLDYHKLLTLDTFNAAVERVSMKMPAVEESSAQKISRKKSHASRTEVILDGKLHYFKEPGKEVEKGGYGAVKKGFNAQDASEPAFAIKKMREPDIDKATKAAMREVKYNRVLGRQAHFFVHKRVTVVSEWQREKALNQFTRDELLKPFIIDRLKCLKVGLLELNHLHRNYRIHGDVKCQNFILDLNKLTMTLIDFGTSHKKGTHKLFGDTPNYRDPYQSKDHYTKDIYAMGIVVMCLFPEIYRVTFDNDKVDFSTIGFNFTRGEEAIMTLVNLMMNNHVDHRCTSEEALKYCNEIINNYGRLSGEMIIEIAGETINRMDTTVEDALRESDKRTLIRV